MTDFELLIISSLILFNSDCGKVVFVLSFALSAESIRIKLLVFAVLEENVFFPVFIKFVIVIESKSSGTSLDSFAILLAS